MDVEAIEGYAALALREAAMDGDDAPDPRVFCKRIGVMVVRSPRSRFIGRNHAQVGVLDGRPVIRVRHGLPAWLERFYMLHEASHVLLARWGVQRMDEEQIANGMAGAISMPLDALRRAWRKGEDLRDVMERWSEVGQTCCALRVGEARLADTAITIGRRVIYKRSDQPIDAPLLEYAARASTGEPVVSERVRAYPLADGKRRAALVVNIAA